ncbi:MAG: disulfide bond formation protein B [Methylococcales bacterium]|nr:disulfide bond formation protein B [Methylococcales bacterium]
MLNLIKFNPRIWFLIGFISCFLMLATGAYFQFVEELEPCPLCISQRIAILVTGLVFVIAAIHNPKASGLKVYSIMGTITALAGAAISIRHVWIQHLPPDEVPECGPGLEYVFENFPLLDTIKLMLNGTGECADILWTFLGLSIPGWTLVAFIALALLSLLQQWNTPRLSS